MKIPKYSKSILILWLFLWFSHFKRKEVKEIKEKEGQKLSNTSRNEDGEVYGRKTISQCEFGPHWSNYD